MILTQARNIIAVLLDTIDRPMTVPENIRQEKKTPASIDAEVFSYEWAAALTQLVSGFKAAAPLGYHYYSRDHLLSQRTPRFVPGMRNVAGLCPSCYVNTTHIGIILGDF